MNALERDDLLRALKARFEKHVHRHAGVAWPDVLARLDGDARALASLQAMEATGGEPDVIGRDEGTGRVTFCDCSAESPAGRRSLCYDRAALDARKENKPAGSAVEMAAGMGIDLLTEEQYRALQALGEFDVKTSSWVETPSDVRALGGVIDRSVSHPRHIADRTLDTSDAGCAGHSRHRNGNGFAGFGGIRSGQHLRVHLSSPASSRPGYGA